MPTLEQVVVKTCVFSNILYRDVVSSGYGEFTGPAVAQPVCVPPTIVEYPEGQDAVVVIQWPVNKNIESEYSPTPAAFIAAT